MGIENRRANFKYRTTLIQKRSSADENHGWCLVEVIKRFMEMDEQYGRLPEVDFYAGGEQVVTLTRTSLEVRGGCGGRLGRGLLAARCCGQLC